MISGQNIGVRMESVSDKMSSKHVKVKVICTRINLSTMVRSARSNMAKHFFSVNWAVGNGRVRISFRSNENNDQNTKYIHDWKIRSPKSLGSSEQWTGYCFQQHKCAQWGNAETDAILLLSFNSIHRHGKKPKFRTQEWYYVLLLCAYTIDAQKKLQDRLTPHVNPFQYTDR